MTKRILETHGVRRVPKVGGFQDDTHDVRVHDAEGGVLIALSSCDYQARLTPAAARQLANWLCDAADRADADSAPESKT